MQQSEWHYARTRKITIHYKEESWQAVYNIQPTPPPLLQHIAKSLPLHWLMFLHSSFTIIKIEHCIKRVNSRVIRIIKTWTFHDTIAAIMLKWQITHRNEFNRKFVTLTVQAVEIKIFKFKFYLHHVFYCVTFDPVLEMCYWCDYLIGLF